MGDVRWLIVCTLTMLVTMTVQSDKLDEDDEGLVYSNSWAVKVSGGVDVADRIAEKHGFKNMGQVGSLSGYYHFVHEASPKRSARSLDDKHRHLSDEEEVEYVEQQKVTRRVKRDYTAPVDSYWPREWYLKRSKQNMNVIPVWQLGITGKDVVVSILDDGIEHDHPDLQDNYDPQASYDFNDHDSDPGPRYDPTNENKHGTRCAGEVAAAKNDICAVGVAYNSKIGGVRMLDGDVSDVVEASSLSLNSQHIDIYSSSWGPTDDGRTVDGPGTLAKHAFVEGIKKGRGGLGSLFVWASGNGGAQHDSCNCDGYAVSPYTISISSAAENNRLPWYAEKCSSNLATTYSSGDSNQKQVVSTDLHHECTNRHTGTSASAPMAAGFLALALEVNSNLTWRDVQYLVVYTSNPNLPYDSSWTFNGAGLKVSHSFGFGMIDAMALVQRARRWTNVPEQTSCNISVNTEGLPEASHSQPLIVSVTVDTTNCPSVAYLEHVQAVTTMDVTRGYRGRLNLSLRSPADTVSTLLFYRSNDYSREGFDHWPFMSVLSWGESPVGKWEVTLSTQSDTGSRLKELNLILYGVPVVPVSVASIPSQCHSECVSGCSGVGPQYCDSCKHMIMDDTWECVSTCPDGTYQDHSVCRTCSEYCATCTSSSECTKCEPGTLRVPSGLCHSVCPNSTYQDQNGSCQPCHLSCLHCIGPLESDCTLCHSSQYKLNQYKLNAGVCELQTKCTAGEYFDHRVFECRQCHNLCAECSGREESDCTACDPGKVLTPDGHCSEDKQLTQKCAQGKYLAEGKQDCVVCPSGCSTCEDDVTCTNCSKGMFLHSSKVGESREVTVTCVETCPTGFYGDRLLTSCMGCPTECTTCDDPHHCLSCSEFSATPVNGVCPQPCSTDTYFDLLNHACVPCPSQCSSCQEAGSCTGCVSGLLLTLDGQCAKTCPNKTMENPDKGRCESTACSDSCLTCLGPEPDQCLSCEPPLILHENTCLDSCPSGKYDTGHSCAPCHPSCATCGGPSESECDTCPQGLLLDHFHCIASCPPGSASSSGLCVSCPENCMNCSSATTCDSCLPPLVFDSQANVCVSNCPVGFFSSSGRCKECSFPCTSCSSEEYCDSCPENMSLIVSGSASACVHCCTQPLHLPCCNCSSYAGKDDQCVLVTAESPTEAGTSDQVPGEQQSFPLPAVVSIAIATAIAIIVLLVGIVYLQKKDYFKVNCKRGPEYSLLSPGKSPFGLTLHDDILASDDDSETEVYVKSTDPNKSIPA